MSDKQASTPAATSRAELLPELKEQLSRSGNLTKEIMSHVALKTGLPLNEVYGVASFYSYLPLAPAGKNVIRVCGCLPCEMQDSKGVIASIRKVIGIGPGQSTSDGKFTVEEVGCIGACDLAPAVMINGKLYGDLNPDKIAQILKSF